MTSVEEIVINCCPNIHGNECALTTPNSKNFSSQLNKYIGSNYPCTIQI